MKPTEKQIEKAANNGDRGTLEKQAFEDGVKWLLEWQKTQPLEVFYVMVGECEIVDVCRTFLSAERSISDLKKDFNGVDFWIDERIIK
jgi:hypothetical protein